MYGSLALTFDRGAINAMPAYQETFGLEGEGSTTGIIFIIYNLGQIAAFPFCGFFADGKLHRLCTSSLLFLADLMSPRLW